MTEKELDNQIRENGKYKITSREDDKTIKAQVKHLLTNFPHPAHTCMGKKKKKANRMTEKKGKTKGKILFQETLALYKYLNFQFCFLLEALFTKPT